MLFLHVAVAFFAENLAWSRQPRYSETEKCRETLQFKSNPMRIKVFEEGVRGRNFFQKTFPPENLPQKI